jgi:hypothetical protein
MTSGPWNLPILTEVSAIAVLVSRDPVTLEGISMLECSWRNVALQSLTIEGGLSTMA